MRGRNRYVWAAPCLAAVVAGAALATPPSARAQDPPLTWTSAAAAPVPPRANATLVRLGPDRVLFAGGGNAAACVDVLCADAPRPQPSAIFDESTRTWHRAAPLPDGIAVYRDVAGYTGDTYTQAVSVAGDAWMIGRRTSQDVLLRYSGTEDGWTVRPLPNIGGRRPELPELVAAGDRLVVIDALLHRPNQSVGVVLDRRGHRVRSLPRVPFRTPFSVAAVWAGGRLLALDASAPQRSRPVEIASIDLGHGGWTALPSARVGKPVAGRFLVPAAVGNLVVWPTAIYDPVTGRSTPTPAEVRSRLTADQHRLGLEPDGLVLGRCITLGGTLVDTTDNTWRDLPPPRAAASREVAHVGGRSLLRVGGYRVAPRAVLASNETYLVSAEAVGC